MFSATILDSLGDWMVANFRILDSDCNQKKKFYIWGKRMAKRGVSRGFERYLAHAANDDLAIWLILTGLVSWNSYKDDEMRISNI